MQKTVFFTLNSFFSSYKQGEPLIFSQVWCQNSKRMSGRFICKLLFTSVKKKKLRNLLNVWDLFSQNIPKQEWSWDFRWFFNANLTFQTRFYGTKGTFNFSKGWDISINNDYDVMVLFFFTINKQIWDWLGVIVIDWNWLGLIGIGWKKEKDWLELELKDFGGIGSDWN